MGFIERFFDYLDKARSRIYGIFALWLVVPHAPVLFAVFFTDQKLIFQKTNLLKNEYIQATYFNFEPWWMWLVYIYVVLGFATLMTWLTIWILPKVLIKRSYEQELEAEYEREFMKLEKEDALEKRKQELLKVREKRLETQEAQIKKEEKLSEKQGTLVMSENDIWRKEYERLLQTNFAGQLFQELEDAVYEHAGKIRVYDNYGSGGTLFEVNKNVLAYAHGNELITLDQKTGRIEFTRKGLFFSQLYKLDQATPKD